MSERTARARDLIGLAEVAEIIGVSRSTARVHRVNGSLPPTFTELACGPIWVRQDVEKWQAERTARRANAA